MSYVKLSKDSDKLLASKGILLSTDNISETAFAVYSEDDNSLIFYYASDVPEESKKYKGKTATRVIDVIDEVASVRPWNSIRTLIKSVIFDKSFGAVKLTNLLNYFSGFTACETMDLTYLDTSAVTTMSGMFNQCTSLQDSNVVYGLDTSNVTNMYGMFQNSIGFKLLDVSTMDTSKAEDVRYMFYGCSNLQTIYSDDNVFTINASDLNNSSYMFSGCNNLVGGNGTMVSNNPVDASMAHVDTPDNPGYFTAKGD